MSYCRWSCDGYNSDIYCYEGEEGFYIHVASKKRKPLFDMSSLIPVESPEDYVKIHDLINLSLKNRELVSIGLPHDGETFVYETHEETIDQLHYLKDLGYYVPEHAIKTLTEEMNERS